tara:strand:- start:179 stop:472 length:294 start_codon:yes stop_codon:yes gene_type:complete
MIIDLKKYKQEKQIEEQGTKVINIAFQIDENDLDVIKSSGMYFVTNVPLVADRLESKLEQQLFLKNIGECLIKYSKELEEEKEGVHFKMNWYDDFAD